MVPLPSASRLKRASVIRPTGSNPGSEVLLKALDADAARQDETRGPTPVGTAVSRSPRPGTMTMVTH